VTRRLVQPDGWPPPRGYANGVAVPAAGRIVYVAGQIGWDPVAETFESDELVAQVRRALRNVAEVLRAAGAEPHHVTRLTWYITDRAEYLASRRAIGAAYREVMGPHYPAMALLIVSGLLEERAKVEIEATAVVP
jgi:enamine deaminase RidA (YjgF/YER057c/UK114 family)